MNQLDLNFYTVIISIFALITSVISLLRTRKSIDVTIENELGNIELVFLNSTDYLHHNPYHKMSDGKLVYIKVVNPSPIDIGFFDLQLLDENNNLVSYITHGHLRVIDNYQPNQIFFNKSNNIPGGRLNLLESNYGILKSNSFTRLDIPFESTNIKTLTITFKVAMKSYNYNPNAKFRKRYKFFSKTFSIDTNC